MEKENKNDYDAQKAEQLIRGMKKALFLWYGFKPDSRILYIGTEDAYSEVLKEHASQLLYTDCSQLKKEDWQKQFAAAFDYVVCVSILEEEQNPAEIFAIIRTLLKAGGIFLAGMNNRLGLRYFCGDRDPYTNRNFDGIENYRRAYVKKEDIFSGRMYDRAELKQMLLGAGFCEGDFRFYSVLTDLDNPSFLYGEDQAPNEDLTNRVFPTYHYPDTVFLEEAPIYQDLIANGMFHQTANAFLIECSMNGALSDVSQVTNSMERGRENALVTIIHRSGFVEKKAAYPDGIRRLKQLAENTKELKARGLPVVDLKLEHGVCRMPFVKAQTGQVYLKNLLKTDRNAFFEKLDHFRDLILQSSEITKPDRGDGEGVILKKGYLDLVPLNSFVIDEEFVFFDQEFCQDNYPANVLILRMISTLYAGDAELSKLLPAGMLYERYGIAKYLERWQQMEWEFLGKLLNSSRLQIYHEKCRKNPEIINANRHRMNYSEMDYQRLFVDVFKGIFGRKVILFGSGIFAKRFLNMYGKECPVDAVVDNNEARWGEKLEGIAIQSPDILYGLGEGEYKVIVCIKNFLSVIRQLDAMGVKNYCVFDSAKAYPIRQVTPQKESHDGEAQPKKYEVGYVAGVFDMFHVGHVKLLQKAKEQCRYLIVGVLSDEDVIRTKKKKPVIPCEDRINVLRSCRYADRVEMLPVNYAGIVDAYKMFGFDCMFSGDDHGNHTDWLSDMEFLKKNGVDVVFFPYTKKVSSTMLREEIGKDKEGKW